jgi:hypothetical protein
MALGKPVSSSLGSSLSKAHGVLNGSIQGVIPHVPFDKAIAPLSLGKLPYSWMCEASECDHRDVRPADEGTRSTRTILFPLRSEVRR